MVVLGSTVPPQSRLNPGPQKFRNPHRPPPSIPCEATMSNLDICPVGLSLTDASDSFPRYAEENRPPAMESQELTELA